MPRIFAQYLAIYTNINWIGPKANWMFQSEFKILQKPTKSCQIFLTFCQSGEISPNLVTV